jgi:predicted RNase H-like nuclease (RuvC/YqgF family)
LKGIKDRISPRLKDTNFPGLTDNETTSSRIEETYNTSETDNLRTKLQEKTEIIDDLKKKLEESHEALEELKDVSQLNERILTNELDIMRSELRELHTNNSKLLSRAEYNEERVKFLSAKLNGVWKI